MFKELLLLFQNFSERVTSDCSVNWLLIDKIGVNFVDLFTRLISDSTTKTQAVSCEMDDTLFLTRLTFA